jgi:hypothetical protein
MADDTDQPAAHFSVVTLKVPGGFPLSTIPTLYADGVVNIAPSPNIAKFYFFRSDPDQSAAPQYQNQVVAQIVMPISGFLQMAAFFEKAAKTFAERGTFSKELWENSRKSEGI